MVWRLYRLIAERVWHQVNNHGELERKGLFCSYELFVESAQQVTLQLIAEARQVAFQTSELFFCKREFSTMRDPNPPIVYMHGYCTKTRYVGLNVREAFLGSLFTLFPPWIVKSHTGQQSLCCGHQATFSLFSADCTWMWRFKWASVSIISELNGQTLEPYSCTRGCRLYKRTATHTVKSGCVFFIVPSSPHLKARKEIVLRLFWQTHSCIWKTYKIYNDVITTTCSKTTVSVSLCSPSAVWPNLSSGSLPHFSLPCSRRRKEGAVEPCACAQGCFSHSPSLKVSWATGVSLSLTGDQLAERRMITASFAVIQPSHISMNCSQRSHWSCLLLRAGQRYWSVSTTASLFHMRLFFHRLFLYFKVSVAYLFPPWC